MRNCMCLRQKWIKNKHTSLGTWLARALARLSYIYVHFMSIHDYVLLLLCCCVVIDVIQLMLQFVCYPSSSIQEVRLVANFYFSLPFYLYIHTNIPIPTQKQIATQFCWSLNGAMRAHFQLNLKKRFNR